MLLRERGGGVGRVRVEVRWLIHVGGYVLSGSLFRSNNFATSVESMEVCTLLSAILVAVYMCVCVCIDLLEVKVQFTILQ